MKIFSKQTTSLLLLLSITCGANASDTFNNNKPNIIFILIDDMGKGDIGKQNNGVPLTPNIDQLANNSKRYEQFYTVSPICSPSRVSFFTGNYPSDYKIHSFIHTKKANTERDMSDFLEKDVMNLARLTKAHGYKTAHIGKWHMGGGRDVGNAPKPTDYGFDRSYVSFEGLGDRLLFSNHQNKLSTFSAQLGNGAIDWYPKDQTTEVYIDKSISFIDDSLEKQQPFYLQLWLNDVHDPHMPKGDFSQFTYQERFHRVLSSMDKQLGRLFKKINSTPDLLNTLIIFTSDNGPVSSKKYYSNNANAPGDTNNLRGRKWSLYEGGINMPFFIHWPKKIKATTDKSTLMSSIDLLPTIAGVLAHTPIAVAGTNLSQNWITGEEYSPEATLYFEYGSTGNNYRHMKPYLLSDQSPELAIRQGVWKLLMSPNAEYIELYNIIEDPKEVNNISKLHPKIVESLTHKLLYWRNQFPQSTIGLLNETRQ